MNIFQELLNSYGKLKRRTLVISLEEAKAPLDPQAQQKANTYISQAQSKAGQPYPNNRVPIAELGGKNVWISAESGKPVTDAFGNRNRTMDPNGGNVEYQNYQDFVKLFMQGAGTEQGGQPQAQEPVLPMSPSINPKISKSFMKAFQGTIDLIKGNFFLHDGKTPAWMDEGPDKMFNQLAMKFTRVNGSLEQKLANSYGLMFDPASERFTKVPVDEYDRETAAETFKEFVSKCGKFKDNTFNEEDAVWVSHHVTADKNGLWFRHPVKLDYGIAFDWNNSYTQTQDKFFANLVESYNRAYEEWAETKRTNPVFTIKFQQFRQLPIINRPNGLNDIRGKTAEEYQVAIHALAMGDKAKFRATVTELSTKFGTALVDAYNYGQSFQQEQNVGTEQLAGYQELVDSLTSLAQEDGVTSNLHQAVFDSVIKRLLRIEAKGMLIRNPKELRHVGRNVSKGAKVDNQEVYNSPNEAAEAWVQMGFGSKEMTGMVHGNGIVNVGLKTGIKPDDVKMGGGSIDAMLDSLGGKSDKGFMTKMFKDLGIEGHASDTQIKAVVEKMQSSMDKLELGMAKISNPKMDQGAMRRQTLSMLNELVRKQFGFNDLISVDNFNDFDLENDIEMDRLKSYIKRKAMAGTIRKGINSGKKEYKAFLALSMCSVGCAQQNQVTNVRFLSTEESLNINHNEAIQQAARNLLEGTYTLDQSDSSTLSIMDERGVPCVRMGLARAKENSNVAAVSLTLSYLRAIAKKPNHIYEGDTIYKFLHGQKTLLENLLKGYALKKKASPKPNKSDNSKIVT